MDKQIRTIGVLTSGGDAQGMNACIRAVHKNIGVELGGGVMSLQLAPQPDRKSVV